MSAESPERARGANRSIIWGDELGSWPDIDMLHQLMLSLRKGESKFYGTTTPRANETIVYLYRHAVFDDDPPQEGKWVRIIRGNTYENLHNLSSVFKNTIVSTYENTRLGEQELKGVLLLDAEGALWSTETIVKQTLKNDEQVPALARCCIGVDPAVSTGKSSDNTGIVVSGLGEDANGYVLEDHTGKYSPEGWVNKVLALYDHYSQFCATSIIVEKNQGGDFIKQSIERARPFLPVDYTFSSRSKIQRAQPIALLFEQGKVFLAKTFTDLETEMTGYEGKPRQKSPDHLDAMVFSLYGCMPLKNRVTKGFEMLL
jgi:predicted phage terminase large subunit-like protein